MITAGGRAAIFLVFGHALVSDPLPTRKAMMQDSPESGAQSRIVDPPSVLHSTAAAEPKPTGNRAEVATSNHETTLRRPDSPGAPGPTHESDIPRAGMRDLLSGMAIGGAVVLLVWGVIHWLPRMKRARFRRDRSGRGLPASSTVDADEERRLAARREMLAKLEIAEAGSGSDPFSSGEQTDPDKHVSLEGPTSTKSEREALLDEDSRASVQDGNGTGWARRVSVALPSQVSASIEHLLEGWDDAFRQGDLDACRRAMTALVRRIEATTAEHLREKTERMSQDLEVSLRERFGVCVRDLDYRGALAVGCEIKRQLPASSIATDFDRIHPYLLRRIERSPT